MFQLGRIVACVGMAGDKVDPDRLTLVIGGREMALGGYFPEGLRIDIGACIRDGVVRIAVGLGMGEGAATTRAVACPE